jgi:plastocyanin
MDARLNKMRLDKRGHGLALLAAGTIAAALAVAGCGSGSGPSAGPSAPASSSAAAPASGPASSAAAVDGQQVTITGNNMLRFSPMTVHAHTGKVQITLKDMGAYPHNIVIPGLGITSKTVTGDPGGSTASFTVTFTHSGSYAFHCQYHASSGMVGTFVVS